MSGEGEQGETDPKCKFSYMKGICSAILLHSRVTVVNCIAFGYFKIARKEDLECFHHEEMINV